MSNFTFTVFTVSAIIVVTVSAAAFWIEQQPAESTIGNSSQVQGSNSNSTTKVQHPDYSRRINCFDPVMTPYIDAGYIDVSALRYETEIRLTLCIEEGFTGRSTIHTDGDGGASISIHNAPIRDIVEFFANHVSSKRVLFSSDFVSEERWDVFVSRPQGWTYEETKKELLSVLKTMFDFTIDMQTKATTCLVPNYTEVDTDIIVNTVHESSRGTLRPINSILRSMEEHGDLFVLLLDDEDALYIAHDKWQDNMTAAKHQEMLESLGVRFTIETRDIPFSVVTQNN